MTGSASSTAVAATCDGLRRTSGEGNCALAMAAARASSDAPTAFGHAALNPGPAHPAKLHARLVDVPATLALCAHPGLVFPSVQLAPLQPYTTAPAKLVFRTVLSTAKGTKHEAHNSFERRVGTPYVPKQQLSYLTRMMPGADRLQADFLPSGWRLREKNAGLSTKATAGHASVVVSPAKDCPPNAG